MFPANGYIIRRATPDDESALRRLAELDSRRPISGPAVIGDIDGVPAAAVSLVDGRVIADPFQRTTRLISLLHLRVRALEAFSRTPSLRERLRAGIRPVAEAA